MHIKRKKNTFIAVSIRAFVPDHSQSPFVVEECELPSFAILFSSAVA